MDYQKINAETIDRWVEEGWEWGQPISHEEYIKARHGIWDVVLTPTKKALCVRIVVKGSKMFCGMV